MRLGTHFDKITVKGQNASSLAEHDLKIVSATFLWVWLVCLTEGTCETKKNVLFHF